MNLIIIAGGTGEGKSRFLNTSLLMNDVRPDFYGKDKYHLSLKSRNQYIFDLNNEYILPVDNILRPQMRHVACDAKTFINNCKALKNTNIVFEDASGFLRGRQAPDIIRLIVQRRHVKNNWIILFHSINRIPPELMEYCNYLIIFKTNDNLKEIDQKFNNEKINISFQKLQSMKKHTYFQIKML